MIKKIKETTKEERKRTCLKHKHICTTCPLCKEDYCLKNWSNYKDDPYFKKYGDDAIEV